MKKRKKYQKFDFKSSFMESFLNDLDQAMKNIASILKSKKINFCFIGAAALSKYNYSRLTQDLDILIDKKDKSKFKKLNDEFYISLQSADRIVQWLNPEVELDIFYSKTMIKTGELVFDDPSRVSHNMNNLPIMNLSNLIEYKLSSGIYGKRSIDFGDVEKLIKINKLSKSYAEKNNFRDDLKVKYGELWKNVQEW
jgi:hypothetical protein